ncbi:hypothetical protein BD289DRAFT_80197 [Coniella lustricola]|uniref:Uncharacterized protein n=1 Tax=Coniella lustricola TaxID=2025994 RepID=A0A2T2ZZ62_9PEZI|nr:hypothetical protein BD289DRAFT_80197 [Coniella lustricola]
MLCLAEARLLFRPAGRPTAAHLPCDEPWKHRAEELANPTQTCTVQRQSVRNLDDAPLFCLRWAIALHYTQSVGSVLLLLRLLFFFLFFSFFISSAPLTSNLPLLAVLLSPTARSSRIFCSPWTHLSASGASSHSSSACLHSPRWGIDKPVVSG